MNAPIRFAVIGASRGRTFIKSALNIGETVKLTAVCDQNPAALEDWGGDSGLRLYSDYEQVLSDPEIDAVCLATPVPFHARQAIAALEAGKHVLSEVTACYTLEEGWDLVAAVERSGLTYMMAENYCYIAAVLQVQNMVEHGVFGDLIYASGSYIHDCRNLYFTNNGELTWRGHLRRELQANSYPTHSLGPVARWLGVNRTDRLMTTATWQSGSHSAAHYARRNQSDRTEYVSPDFWQHADTVSTTIRTEKGALIDMRLDWCSARPHHMTRYELGGTRASFSWPDGIHAEPLIWIEDRSPTNEQGIAREWEPLAKYREEYEHPLWREHRALAEKAGHGGGDYFILREFCASIREQRLPMIDVYDAVTWSSITPLSQQSIASGNAPVEVPNFKAGRILK
ncbi:Gfo/Idh/MocA family oxidoreductase [soil metagenome]